MNKSSMMFFVLSTFFVLALTNVACTQQQKDIKVNTSNLEVGKTEAVSDEPSTVYPLTSVQRGEANKFVDFTFTKDGQEVSIKDFTKGKYVFLNFWGTWCPPCRAEIPYLIDIQKELGDELVVVGLALERPRDFAQASKLVEDYAKAQKINYINIVIPDGNALKGQIVSAYGGIQFVPTTFLIDPDGNIIEKIQGGRTKEQFMESINKMMKKS